MVSGRSYRTYFQFGTWFHNILLTS